MGFELLRGFLDSGEHDQLTEFVRTLPYRNIRMHGVTSRRRVVQFGFHYAFESFRLTPSEPRPEELEGVRERAAAVAGIDAREFAEALVTEYTPGAGIGWHRDAPSFGIVAGISLASSCRMRFQTGEGALRRTAAVELPPRSLYLLTGEARTEWQHMIPPARALRYSITFRTIRRPVREYNQGGDST